MKKQTGFTLVELVIVIAVLGILAGMAIPHFMEAREEAAKKECLANRTQIMRMFYAQQAVGYSETLAKFLGDVIDETKGNKYFTFVPKCADGGEYSVSNEVVVCTITEHNEESVIVSGGLGKDFYDKIVDALISGKFVNNDDFRKKWLEGGNDWEAINTPNSTMYLMVHVLDAKGNDPIIYVNPAKTGNNWQVKYIYDAVNGKWYGYKLGTKSCTNISDCYNETNGSSYVSNLINNDKDSWTEVTLNGNTFSK